MYALIFIISITGQSHSLDGFKSQTDCETAGKQILAKVTTPSEVGGMFVCVKK